MWTHGGKLELKCAEVPTPWKLGIEVQKLTFYIHKQTVGIMSPTLAAEYCYILAFQPQTGVK